MDDMYESSLDEMLRKNRQKAQAQERYDKAEAYSLLDAEVLEVDSNGFGFKGYGSRSKINQENHYKNNNAHYTAPKGFTDNLKYKQTHRKNSAKLFVAALALAASSFLAVKFLTPKEPKIDTANLRSIASSTMQDSFERENVQDVINFANEYENLYLSGNIDRQDLAKAYKEFYNVCGNTFKSKVSAITNVDKEDIAVVKDKENLRVVKGHLDSKGLVVVQDVLIDNDNIPEDLRPVLEAYVRSIDVNKDNVPFSVSSKSQIKNEAKKLRGFTIDLVNLAGQELIFDGQNFNLASFKTKSDLGKTDIANTSYIEQNDNER